MRRSIEVMPFLFMLAAIGFGVFFLGYAGFLILKYGTSYLLACPSH